MSCISSVPISSCPFSEGDSGEPGSVSWTPPTALLAIAGQCARFTPLPRGDNPTSCSPRSSSQIMGSEGTLLDLHQYACASLILGNCSLWHGFLSTAEQKRGITFYSWRENPFLMQPWTLSGASSIKAQGCVVMPCRTPFLYCKALWLPRSPSPWWGRIFCLQPCRTSPKGVKQCWPHSGPCSAPRVSHCQLHFIPLITTLGVLQPTQISVMAF